jgi:hypothetical protein
MVMVAEPSLPPTVVAGDSWAQTRLMGAGLMMVILAVAVQPMASVTVRL